MKLKYYAIPALIIAVCLVFAVAVRFSYTDVGKKIYDYEYVSDGNLNDVLRESKIAAPEDVIDQADLIVETKYMGDRKVMGYAFYSQVNVSRVYKGDKSLIGKEICVIEPVSVFTETRYVNAEGYFYIPLQSGEKYLLLLKHKKFDPKRKLDDSQKAQYYPVTKSAFGCYRLSDENQTKLIDNNKTYTINLLKNYDIFTSDKKTLDTYYQYKQQILKTIGI